MKKLFKCTILSIGIACIMACAGTQAENSSIEYARNENTDDEGAMEAPETEQVQLGEPVRIPLSYAQEYTMDRYEGGYTLITVAGTDRFLVVPVDMPIPEGIDGDITVLRQPVNNIYLVATATMDMFRVLDGLGSIRLSGTDAQGWCIEEVTQAMERGEIVYAGKYSAPDYELILSENCGLAVENTMIDHSPEVRENLESFGIPVLVDYSSYESHPLGRVEWVKLYGVLLDKEAEAEAAFHAQEQLLEEIEQSGDVQQQSAAGVSVAFFYITNNGAANVRRASDYVPKMIELAGGKYIYDDLGDEESHASSTTMQIEEFYATAKDADYIIYNSTIDGELRTVEELIDKCGLLADFKAVQEGHVYCTTQNLYQESMSIGTMINDIHKMLTGEGDMSFLYLLE